MRKFLTLFFVLSLLAGLTYCTEEHPEDKTTDFGDDMPFQLYEYSEMAMLMHAMEEDMLRFAEMIEAGEQPDFPDYWRGLFTADMTKPEQGDALFYEKSEAFIEITEQAFKSFKGDAQKDIPHYNLIVASCIDCHQTHCPGPITRIQKLKWKDDR